MGFACLLVTCSEGSRVYGSFRIGRGRRRSYRSCRVFGRMLGRGSRFYRSRRRSFGCRRSVVLRVGSAWSVVRCRGRCFRGIGCSAVSRLA